MKLVAIHQPNFFPWLGFFNKMARADAFILLDDVQFEKSGRGSWVNRVRLAHRGRAYWATMPVVRAFRGHLAIAEMLIDNRQPWRAKLLRTLELHYGRAPHFEELFAAIRPLVEYACEGVAEYNLHALRALKAMLGLSPEFYLSSQLDSQGQATERLVSLTLSVGGTAYLSGAYAARTYQQPALFEAANLSVQVQQFEHPRYDQLGGADFVPGLSILDCLFHCGVDETSRLVRA